MARIVNFSTSPAAGGQPDPTGGLTLDALMARQKLLAAQQQQIAEPRDMPSPWQGAALLGQTFANRLQEGRVESQLAAGRDALAKIRAGINLDSGPTAEQISQASMYDPGYADNLTQMAAQAVQARRALEAANASREDTQAFTHGENELNRQTEMEKAAQAAKLAAVPKISDISGVRQDVISDPSYKNMAQAVPIWTSMQDAAGRNTPQADLNMVIALAKLFDPTSVVRQSESGAVELTGDLPQALVSQYKYLTAEPGSRLKPKVRQGMLEEGWSRVKGYADAYKQTSDWYGNLANESGIPVDKVVPTFGDLKPYTPPAPAGAPAPPGQPPAGAAVKPGETRTYGDATFVFKGGDPADPQSWTRKVVPGG